MKPLDMQDDHVGLRHFFAKGLTDRSTSGKSTDI